MEKVPSLNIFSQRHMRKSSSVSKLNHYDQSYRPGSSFQSQSNHTFKNNYYDQALKILNVDSQINKNLKQIEKQNNQNLHKTGLRKVGKKQQIESFNPPANNHLTIIHNEPPEFNKVHQSIAINYQQPNFIQNIENVQTRPINYVQKPIFLQQQQQFNSQHPLIQYTNSSQVRPQNFLVINQNQPPVNHQFVNTFQQNARFQRVPSTPNMHFRDYSQPDRIITNDQNSSVNNQEDQKGKNIKKTNSKGQEYTFRNGTQAQQKVSSKIKVTLNPFLFDATYLLQVKESESKLPDLSLTINNKEYFEQTQKKRQLIQQLIEIKETNQIEGHNLLRQLDNLIQQFEDKGTVKNTFDQSCFKGSRKSLFDKTK